MRPEKGSWSIQAVLIDGDESQIRNEEIEKTERCFSTSSSREVQL